MFLTPMLTPKLSKRLNVAAQLSIADGAIVGSAFKRRGVVPGEPIDVEMVKVLMDEVWKLR